MSDEQYDRHQQRREELAQIKADILAIQARIEVLAKRIVDTNVEIMRYSNYVMPEPFLGMAKRQLTKLQVEQIEAIARRERLRAQLN